jgi:hypothetical protein
MHFLLQMLLDLIYGLFRPTTGVYEMSNGRVGAFAAHDAG